MANYTPHQYLRIGGDFGSEEWSVGLRLQVTAINLDAVWETVVEILSGQVPTPTTSNEAISAYLALKIEPIVRTWWGVIKNYNDSAVKWGYLSCNHIGRDGKYTSGQSFRYDIGTPVPGTPTGTNSFTGPDVAMAVSFLTGIKRGYSARGRIYLPATYAPLERTLSNWGQFTSAMRTDVLNATQKLLEDINDLGGVADGVEPSVCVFSPGTGKNHDPSVPGIYRPVTAIRVGGQPDTQRRRLNKVPDLWAGGDTFQAVIRS